MPTPRDSCRGIRRTYGACITTLASKGWVSILCIGLAVYIVAAFLIIQSVGTNYARVLLSKPTYIIFGVMLANWALAAVTIWKRFPNLLSICIFVYNCLGHWSLVSFIILICYGPSMLPGGYMAYIVSGLIPGCIGLMIVVDIMRSVRARLFREIELATRSTDVELAARPTDNVV
jgi:hypothetical protein